MNCNCEQNAIVIVRNNDTDWNGANFLTINLIPHQTFDLATCKATLNMAGIVKTFEDLSSGSLEVNLSATETKTLPPFFNGVLNLIDSTGKVATIESLIPFKVISTVHGNAIATEPYTLNFDVKQGGETILTVNVESAVSVEVGMVATLNPDEDAYVRNSGTDNHLILDFGIPQGVQGERGDDGIDGQDGEPAKINGVNSLTINAIDGIILTQIGNTATISGNQLQEDITDVQNSIGNGTITINQGGVQKGTFTTNQSGNTTINLDAGGSGGGAVDSVNGQTGVVVLDAEDVGALPDSTVIPTKTSDLQNDSGFITNSALSGYATETWVGNQGYITGIDSTDITSALGYTPYNASNPDGFISGITSSDVTTALGYTPEQSMTIQTLSATDSITLADNTIYNGGEQTALTITLPSTVDVSFLCEIDFTSSTSPTTLTYSNTIKWTGDDVNNNVFLPVASKRYTIICAYDGVNWRFTVKGVE